MNHLAERSCRHAVRASIRAGTHASARAVVRHNHAPGHFAHMRIVLPAAIAIAVWTAGCNESSPQADGGEAIVGVEAEDAEMNAAIAHAQSTLSRFVTALEAPQPGQKDFLVKAKFTAGDLVEHMWIADITYDGHVFRGVLANEPESIPGLSYLQRVEVQPAQISDWMHVQDDIVIGGYTMRVLRSRMTDQERSEPDAGAPYKSE